MDLCWHVQPPKPCYSDEGTLVYTSLPGSMNDQGSSSFLDVVLSNFGLKRFIGRNDARRKLAVMHGNSVRSSLSRCKLHINYMCTIHGRNQKLCSSALCVAAKSHFGSCAMARVIAVLSLAAFASPLEGDWRSKKIDCSLLKPPPYGLRMENRSFCLDVGCHRELRTVVNLNQKDCGEHFVRLSAVDDFVALKWKVRYRKGVLPVEFCSAMSTAVWTKGPKICSA